MNYQTAKAAIADILVKNADNHALNSQPAIKNVFNFFDQSDYHNIPLTEYLNKICQWMVEYDNAEENHLPLLIGAYIYIQRFTQAVPEIGFCQHSAHRVIATSFLISHKFHLEHAIKNVDLAEISGISLKEFNDLESSFLFFLRFNLMITKDEYDAYYSQIKNYADKILKPLTHSKNVAKATHLPAHEVKRAEPKATKFPPLPEPYPMASRLLPPTAPPLSIFQQTRAVNDDYPPQYAGIPFHVWLQSLNIDEMNGVRPHPMGHMPNQASAYSNNLPVDYLYQYSSAQATYKDSQTDTLVSTDEQKVSEKPQLLKYKRPQ